MKDIIYFSAILNKSDSRSRKSYSTVDCDSDEDSDEDIFNDIYADLNDLEEFHGESTEAEVRDQNIQNLFLASLILIPLSRY